MLQQGSNWSHRKPPLAAGNTNYFARFMRHVFVNVNYHFSHLHASSATSASNSRNGTAITLANVSSIRISNQLPESPIDNG
jgi:hypothetical protein